MLLQCRANEKTGRPGLEGDCGEEERPGLGHGFTGSRVHGFTGSRVHGFTGSRVHGFTGSRVHGFTGSRVHGFTGSRVHGFTGSRVHGFTGSRVHGFTGSRVHGCARSARHLAVQDTLLPGVWGSPSRGCASGWGGAPQSQRRHERSVLLWQCCSCFVVSLKPDGILVTRHLYPHNSE